MSVAADFTVTQVVDGRQGIHARIPRSVFPPKK
jgi:formamidase